MRKIICFGEVLWDVFPDGKKVIGGAPLNVAMQLLNQGYYSEIISAIGQDALGQKTLNEIHRVGLEVNNLTILKEFKTGQVEVSLDQFGTASYHIDHPVAWDRIPLTKNAIESVKNSEAFVYGTLSSRDIDSRQTLTQLVEHSSFNVLDVNLRVPFYSKEILQLLIKKAHFLKINEEEIIVILQIFGVEPKDTPLKNLRLLSALFNGLSICLTMGSSGSILFHENRFYHQEAYTVKVVDTVGAGDSFLATLIGGLITGITPEKCLKKASIVGAMVASSKGANPYIDWDLVNQLF